MKGALLIILIGLVVLTASTQSGIAATHRASGTVVQAEEWQCNPCIGLGVALLGAVHKGDHILATVSTASTGVISDVTDSNNYDCVCDVWVKEYSRTTYGAEVQVWELHSAPAVAADRIQISTHFTASTSATLNVIELAP